MQMEGLGACAGERRKLKILPDMEYGQVSAPPKIPGHLVSFIPVVRSDSSFRRRRALVRHRNREDQETYMTLVWDLGFCDGRLRSKRMNAICREHEGRSPCRCRPTTSKESKKTQWRSWELRRRVFMRWTSKRDQGVLSARQCVSGGVRCLRVCSTRGSFIWLSESNYPPFREHR